MLKKNDAGLYFVSDKTGKIYYLHKGTALEANKTDDVCYIMDSGFTEEEHTRWMNGEDLECKETFVNWFLGATFLEDDNLRDEYANIIKDYVDEYEKRVDYDFTFDDLDWFLGNIEEDALEEIEKFQNRTWIDQDKLDINIRVGNHYVKVPYTDDNYIRLNDFIMECREETVDIKRETNKENKDMTNKQEYVTKKMITDSCYTEVLEDVMAILVEEHIDGWHAAGFLSWLYLEAKECANNFYDGDSRDLFFALYNKEEIDMMTESNVKFGFSFKDCVMDKYNGKYYRINMTEDCSLEEIVPKCKTIDEQILDTLLAYQDTNKEVLSDVQNIELQDQIDYMRERLKEDA